MEKQIEPKQKSMIQELVELRDYKESTIKKKKMKIPRKAKVRKGRLKKGYLGIIKIDENGNISGEKQKLEDSTIRLKDKTYHSIRGDEIGMWDGKFPVVILPIWKKNPIKVKRAQEEINETHGQKYIMARMLGDTIKVKAAAGAKGLMYIIIAGVVAYGAYMLFTGQL